MRITDDDERDAALERLRAARLATLDEIAALEAFVAAAGTLDAPGQADRARMHGMGVAAEGGGLDAMVTCYEEVRTCES